MVRIPLQAIPSQTLRTELDGQDATIHLYYRFGNMYMDLYIGNDAVQLGAVCRFGASIIQRTNTIFKGSLHFLDMVGDADPMYAYLDDRFRLFYVSEGEELPARFTA